MKIGARKKQLMEVTIPAVGLDTFSTKVTFCCSPDQCRRHSRRTLPILTGQCLSADAYARSTPRSLSETPHTRRGVNQRRHLWRVAISRPT